MSVKLNQIVIGDNKPFVLIAGPCVVENEKMILETAEAIKKIYVRSWNSIYLQIKF